VRIYFVYDLMTCCVWWL